MRSGNELTNDVRNYYPDDSCIFKKNADEFGGFSNMSSSFPLRINGILIRSSEALYQLCRFPFEPSIQSMIVQERSPMIVKNISKKYASHSRADWEQVRVKIMKWCVKVKLAQNFNHFGELFDKSSGRNIVENSARDAFWGAVPNKDGTEFRGVNALGRILMGLRSQYFSANKYQLLRVENPKIEDFLIINEPINAIDERLSFINCLVKQLGLSIEDVSTMLSKSDYLSSLHNDKRYFDNMPDLFSEIK